MKGAVIPASFARAFSLAQNICLETFKRYMSSLYMIFFFKKYNLVVV